MESSNYGKCRCCSSIGNHKDVLKEYYSNGSREVFIDMFMEVFNLFLTTDANITTLICKSCVQHLRNANTFKTMVMNTEKELLEFSNSHTLFISETHTELDIKSEPVKMEDEEPVYLVLNEDHDDSDFDDYESVPLPDPEDLVPGEADLLSRFSMNELKMLPTKKTLADICPQYASRLDWLKGKVITGTMITTMMEEEEKRNSNDTYLTEKLAQLHNVSSILKYSNVAPFKGKTRAGFPCFYCRNLFDNITELRKHQTATHKPSDAKAAISTYGVEGLVVYVDINDLECNICKEKLTNLNELRTHLTKEHKIEFFREYTDRVIPFKLKDTYINECQICGFNFETFGSIERHMNVHFRNYVCKDCGSGFVSKYRLKVHIKSMHIDGSYPCEICQKIFTTVQKRKNHVDTVHKLVKRFKCPKCSERFSEYFRRQKHMVLAHGVEPLQYKCNVCDKSFDRRYTLSRHMKRDHLEERDFQCELCSYKCFTNNELRVHMVKHNGERIFECSVCKKSYARRKTLREHMRIHNNDRRFACSVCGQAFVQKCSLKGHLKTHHMEFAMQ